jgi:hypothetical protein
MESEGSLPCSQQSATGPYPEPDESNLYPLSYLFTIHFNIILHLRLVLPSGLFPSGFPTRTSLSIPPLSYATCLAYLILHDLIILIVFGEDYKL